MKCLYCGNQGIFTTERMVLHWVKVDGEAGFVQDDGPEGDSDRPTGIDEPLDFAYIECGECNSDDVEV